jgi:hypothetical protein
MVNFGLGLHDDNNFLTVLQVTNLPSWRVILSPTYNPALQHGLKTPAANIVNWRKFQKSLQT